MPLRRDQGIVLEGDLQRVWRDALPFGGSAGLEVRLDGELVLVVPAIEVLASMKLAVPVGRCDGQAHELTLRLTGNSTGLLWLCSVAIR
jgi:hypothetical protein